MRNIDVVRNAALTLCAIALIGCGGGGGGGNAAAPSASAPLPAPPATSSNPPPTAGVPTPPSFAGPSVLPSGSPGRFEGATLPAGTAVTIMIRQPDGTETSQTAMVDATGRISHDIAAAGSGVHTVRVIDASGRELTAVNFIGL